MKKLKEGTRFNLIYSGIAFFIPGAIMGYLNLDGAGLQRMMEKTAIIVWSLLAGILVFRLAWRVLKDKLLFNARLAVYVLISILLFNIMSYFLYDEMLTVSVAKSLLACKPDAGDASIQMGALVSCLITVFIFKTKYEPVEEQVTGV